MSSRAVASSSMTSTQSALDGRPLSKPAGLCAGESAVAGRRAVKTEPVPGSLVTVTSPPIMRELATDRKAEASSSEFPRGRGIGLGELLEQLGLLFGGHADAGVGHRKLDPIAAIGYFLDP